MTRMADSGQSRIGFPESLYISSNCFFGKFRQKCGWKAIASIHGSISFSTSGSYV